MNIREMAIEYVRNHPGCTAKQIADGAGIPRRLIQPLMSELYICEEVTRAAPKGVPHVYHMPDESEFARLSDAYREYRQQAQALEAKKLWRRAAQVWLMAMDATRDVEARDKATARREHCISCASRPRRWEDTHSGANSVSVPALDVWSDW